MSVLLPKSNARLPRHSDRPLSLVPMAAPAAIGHLVRTHVVGVSSSVCARLDSKAIRVAVLAVMLCGTGCHPASEPPEQRRMPYRDRLVSTNVSSEAYSVLVELTGCFLAAELFLPEKTTAPLPAEQFEVVYILPSDIDQSTYTVLIDHTDQQYWVLKADVLSAMGEFYGPKKIDRLP